MCGIFATLNHNSDSDCVTKTVKSLNNRGPEKSSFRFFEDKYLAFGFNRLAINGYKEDSSDQPISMENCTLICNGEIYNWKELHDVVNIDNTTGSDCEIIIHMYKLYGMEYTLTILDGVYAFILYDHSTQKIYVARDAFGIRPLFYSKQKDTLIFSSEMKQIEEYTKDKPHHNIQFYPGTFSEYKWVSNGYWYGGGGYWNLNYNQEFFNTNISVNKTIKNDNMACRLIRTSLERAVAKRVKNTDRPIACLLSGGLDSSLITALVRKHFGINQLHTWSIGLKGSDDLKHAKIVANHLKTIHHEICLSEQQLLDAIETVIFDIESYDTTTVRASVPNWLICKYIKEQTESKVIFNGDGSDELTGGYMYFYNCPDIIEFDKECKRLLQNIHFYDVLRSDRSISSHGLEPRTPFLDREFVECYLSIPISIRNYFFKQPKNHSIKEKFLLRKAFYSNDDKLLPDSILWRSKEAFSDGVSKVTNSWHHILQNHIKKHFDELLPGKKPHQIINNLVQLNNITHNIPTTLEQLYYRLIFEKHYPNQGHTIPKFWMPKYTDVTDASARELKVYKDNLKKEE